MLDIEAARKSVQSVADIMGLSTEETAEGILKLVNEVRITAGGDSGDIC